MEESGFTLGRSVDRKALWKLLSSLGLNSKVVEIMKALHTCSYVNMDGVMSDWFSISSGVRRECRIAPDLFLEPMDRVMQRIVHRGMNGVMSE